MPVSIGHPRTWSAEEFYRFRDSEQNSVRYELADGLLLVTPSPSRRHQSIIVQLAVVLNSYVKENELGELLVAPYDVRFDKRVILQPDLLVIPPDAPFRNSMAVTGELSLAIEILSRGSARHDRVTKRLIYARYGLPEYWIVDDASRTVERWIPQQARPEVVSGVLQWSAGGAEPFELDLEEFFSSLPGAEQEDAE